LRLGLAGSRSDPASRNRPPRSRSSDPLRLLKLIGEKRRVPLLAEEVNDAKIYAFSSRRDFVTARQAELAGRSGIK
jgi:hypothetical protein